MDGLRKKIIFKIKRSIDTAKKFKSVSLPSKIFLARNKDEFAKWKYQEIRDRIDNTCHDQKTMGRVQEELKSYDEDELFNGDPFADECLDLDI